MAATGKPFQKGADTRRNTKGRPKKGTALTEILNSKLDELHGKGEKLKREVIAEKLIALAISGDLNAMRYIFDRTDGRPAESITLSSGETDRRLREILNGN